MSQQVTIEGPLEAQVPEKCRRSQFLDKETDHMLEVTQVHLYCRAPLWHPKRWTCSLPAGVARA